MYNGLHSMTDLDTERLILWYPRVFFACHRRHMPDPKQTKAVTDQQIRLLGHLDPVHPFTLKALARHMGVTPATMSIHIERLVRMGLVRRDPGAIDRREVSLRLTEDGMRLMESQSVLEPEQVARLLANLTPEEKQEALRGLGLLARAADALIREWKQSRTANAEKETEETRKGK